MFLPSWKSLEGKHLGEKYVLEALLGIGGFGGVFQAQPLGGTASVAKVAVKLMVWDDKREQQQGQELELATALKHDKLIGCYDSFVTEVEGLSFLALVMELADYSLKTRFEQLSAGELLPESERDQVIGSVLEALCFLHGQGIVHRDIKPDNVLWVNGQWKVADFGISRILEERTSTNTSVDNLSVAYRYMPPEAVEGIISPHWDIWSLGILMTLLLTGEHPFPHNNTMQLSWKICHEAPVFACAIESLYFKMVCGCLTKQRHKRWRATKLLSYFTVARSAGKTEAEINHFLQERLEEIEILRQHDDYGEIITLCEIILDLQPDHSEAWYIKGEAHSCLEQFQEALDAYEQSTRYNPHYTMAIHARDYISKKIQSKSI